LTLLPAIATLIALVFVAPADAHSLLLGSTPAPNAVLTASPPVISLKFNNRIEKRLSHVRLVDERGAVAVALVTTRAEDAAADSVVAKVPPLAPGAWRVEWQVFSTDGHVVSGTYAFRLAP
jgi:methionine-rich copper-binding protein CopC